MLPLRARLVRDAQPRRGSFRCRHRGRLLAARPRRRSRHLPLLQCPRARARPARPDRRDGPGHPAGRADIPVVHQLVLPAWRARDVALALPGLPVRRAALRPAEQPAAEESLRHIPVRAACRIRPAPDEVAYRRRHRRRAAALLPALVQGYRPDPRAPRDGDREPPRRPAAHPVTAPVIPGGLRRYFPAGTSADPDVAGGWQAGRMSPWPAASGRWFLLAWLIVLVVLAANDPGRMIFDTKLGVDIDPAGFFGRLWPLWNPLEWLGTLQDQYIGYAVPMAPFFLVGRFLGLPVWIIERLWLSLLIAAGFWGVTKLATALRIGSDGARLLAGAVVALWPPFTIIIGSTSAAALPGLLAPWAILPLVTGLRGRGSIAAACARSGIAIVLMGGWNAVVTICPLVLPAPYILTHTRGMWRIRVFLSWGVAVPAATALWAGPPLLPGGDPFNFLP